MAAAYAHGHSVHGRLLYDSPAVARLAQRSRTRGAASNAALRFSIAGSTTMKNTQAKSPMQAPELTSAHAHALLDRLSTDDIFRELFRRDAPAALRAIGVPEDAALCLATRNLASKETLAGAREALTRQLTGTLSQIPNLLIAR
ncbi:MAG TPA: NHLP-related RiPP peptide [Xanthomonadales bacterium]|nr:NHLP-related RiPP peptide [Xanthomonadales bacterium]